VLESDDRLWVTDASGEVLASTRLGADPAAA
jgi:hypothetical protein